MKFVLILLWLVSYVFLGNYLEGSLLLVQPYYFSFYGGVMGMILITILYEG